MDYFESLRKKLDLVYSVAQQARSKGLDPEPKVEIPIAKDVAARVEGLVGPRGIASVIRELEQGGLSRPEIAFNVAEKIASGDIIQGDARTLIEQAIRTSVGILTEGVLVAPTEGIADVKISENPDGSQYVAVLFAGPIRSAGGTVAALSVALADHARKRVGIADFRPTETEISRYVEEVNVYENRCVHLQYKPPDEHVAHIVKHCPVCIDGDPTEEVEVSVHRDLERMPSNRIRGGVPLVICEGIAAKAPKVMKFTKKFGLDWDWLSEVMKVRKKADKVEIKPDFSYLEGLVAGRPVFSYPMEKGGFRLRYGRSRTNGIMGRNVHPATMVLLDSFVANGTHVKVERPGKGAILTTCDSIEPPVVKLKDGSVRKVRTSVEAEELKEELEKILFLGDMLITYGDFSKSNHPLMPAGYCHEWWEQEAHEKGVAPESFPKSAKEAFELSAKEGIPLHPDYTCHWNDISVSELKALSSLLLRGELKLDSGMISSIELPPESGEGKSALEKLLVEHKVRQGGHIILEAQDAIALLLSLGMLRGRELVAAPEPGHELSVLENVCASSGITIRDKAPTYIGARMGRPEKAKERMMEGKPHVLFPTASPKDRSLTKRYKSLKARDRERTINADIARFRCSGCGASTFYPTCHSCGEIARPERVCQKCGEATTHKEHCERPTLFYDRRPVPLVEMYEKAKAGMDYAPAEVKGVKGLVSENKIPELLEKGFFRAKNGVYVFRDGTCRFDATDAPITHFRISEIGQSVEGIKKLGYTHDFLGKPIENAGQVVPMMCQDIVVSSHCMDYMGQVAAFMDDLLVNVYGMPPFYSLKSRDDLLGHLVVGLSPHTSGGVLGRIIGFCDANVGYAHPYFHTAKRRNCDGDEDCVILLADCLINFSRAYLSNRRGGTMDAPLTLTPQINPSEVDDEAHCMEVVEKYPLEFYRACEKNAFPGEVKLTTVQDLLGKDGEYGDLHFTHDTESINDGPMRTRYVTLGSIPEKIEAEFALHARLRPVDVKDAAQRLILSHFIPDLYGNLRSYSRQTFRCVTCNTIYRRTPLSGKCTRCGGKLTLTIHKGGIMKYLEISKRMVEEYSLPAYLAQRLELLEKEISSIFEDEKVKQTGLSDFM
jgi:DNA polymerase II large subunit